VAEQNYANQKSAVSSEGGAGEQHTRQESGSPSQGQIVESTGQQQVKNLRRAAHVPVTGGRVLNDARQRFRTLKQDTNNYVRKNPTKAVFTALGIGFVLALMRRR
jgi:ElaB/YqjD/DUF883 family membrane-anchored ribosome-binding protein